MKSLNIPEHVEKFVENVKSRFNQEQGYQVQDNKVIGNDV